MIGVPPGQVVREIVADSNHTRAWWANRLGYSYRHLSMVMNGQKRVSVDFAVRFERASGLSARGLLRMQADEDLRYYLERLGETEKNARRRAGARSSEMVGGSEQLAKPSMEPRTG